MIAMHNGFLIVTNDVHSDIQYSILIFKIYLCFKLITS